MDMATTKYNSLRETWIYQEIQQEFLAEFAEQHCEDQRQLLVAIVTARFPRMLKPLQNHINPLQDPLILRSLILKIGSARTEKEARQALQTASP